MFQIQKNKFFNTWSSSSPASMVFLPAQFIISIGAYSTSTGTYNQFPFSEKVKLFEHHKDGSYCRLQVEHGGTILEIEYFKQNDWTVRCKISTVKNGEWGLRFIPVLNLGFEGDGKVQRENNQALFSYRSYKICAYFKDSPIRSCLAEDIAYMGSEIEKKGYYAPFLDSENSKYCSAMFNLEETPVIEFSVAVRNSAEEAYSCAKAALALSGEELNKIRDVLNKSITQKGKFGECAEALRDVMAWNAIADKNNGRTVTSATRFWIDKKFGGWFLWFSDTLYHGLINAWAGDWVMAQNNIYAALDNAVPAGNFAGLMAEYTEWVDRSQPPVAGYIALKYYQLTHDIGLVSKVFDTIYDAHLWWFSNRDGNNNGVLEFGSSPCGEGHFKGTKMAAKDEAAMDNSPMFDTADFIKETNTINMEDVGLNSLLALEGESLAILARILGRHELSTEIDKHTQKFKERIDEQLWDESRKIYANRHWENGFVCPSPTSFYPLIAGIPSKDKADSLIEHIFDKEEFWTEVPFPSIWAKDESVHDDVYWRGRAWPPLNYFTYLGLRRNGYDDEAYILAEKSVETFHSSWNEKRACYENYNAFTGDGNSVDTDPFYGWGALIPLMWLNEFIDTDMDGNIEFGSLKNTEMVIDGLKTFLGTTNLKCGEITTLTCDGLEIFSTSARGRLKKFMYEKNYACVKVDKQIASCWVSFNNVTPVQVLINGIKAELDSKIEISANTEAFVEMWF